MKFFDLLLKSDGERFYDLEATRDAMTALGLDKAADAVAWAVDFIRPVMMRRESAADDPGAPYKPIIELPDGIRRDVVFYNSCNGPHLDRLNDEGAAAAARAEGCWTHFILLPEGQ